MPPKTDQKDPKSKDEKKDEPKKSSNDEKDSDQSCTAFAKALIYIVPIALYIPWAYRMFKGQPCCPEVPKPPPTAGPTCTSHGRPKWPKYPGRGKGGSQKGEGSCGAGEAGECQGGVPRECQEENKPNKSPEQDDCGKKSRQCLDKCLDKCLSRDGGKEGKGKGGKRKEKKRNDDCDDDDYDH